MSTQSWSTRYRCDSDAVYQEWRDELITKLAAVGLGVAETNITPGAGGRPAINTEQGYAVFYLNDSMHATAPIYIRFGFGSGSTVGFGRIQVAVGTATNGSGTLSGTASFASTSVSIGGAASSDTARQSYMCAVDGFFGLDWKIGASTNNSKNIIICRTCDSTGAPNATGAIARLCGSSGIDRTAMLRFAAAAAIYTSTSSTTADHYLCLIPLVNVLSSTVVGSDVQAGLCTMYTPRVQPVFGLIGVVITELTPGGTFTATPVGSTPRTFLTCAAEMPDVGLGLGSAMLWE